MGLPEIVSPFVGVNADLELDTSVSAWLTNPPGIVIRYGHGVTIDERIATFVATDCDAALRNTFGKGPFTFVHDYTVASGYNTAGRKILTDWGVRIRKDVAAILVVAPHDNPLIKMGLSAAAAVLRAAGINMRVAKTLDEALADHRLRHRVG